MKEKNGKTIDLLMRMANEKMIINKYLKNKLEFYKKHINLTKDTMNKCFSDKNNSSKDLINAYINEVQKDYDILKSDVENNYNSKYKELYDECLSDITMGKPVLNQMRNEEFSLEYLKMKSNDIINGLKSSIKQSREYHLFREPRRDSLVDNKKGNKEIEKLTTELQQNMLYECKKFNKFSNKIKKYEFQKNELNQNIALIKKYMDTENLNVNTNQNTSTIKNKKDRKKGLFKSVVGENQRSKSKNKNNSDENRGNSSGKKNRPKKSTKDIIKGFIKVEDLFNISSEEEKIIDDELHSDDESVFENRISQEVQLSKTYLDEVRQFIPQINLKQIEYNKLKIIGEADIYSLQRRKYKNQNIDGNIKDFKKKIEKINDKLIVIKKKEKAMKKYLEKYKENYETLRPLKMQTSVYKKEIKFLKKSLFGEDDKIDELSDDEGGVGSDYGNEEKEDSDKEKKKKFAYKNNLKDTVAIPMSNRFNINKKEKKQLKQSVRDEYFTNKLKAKIMNDEKANSK
jgi:hypothetical protein